MAAWKILVCGIAMIWTAQTSIAQLGPNKNQMTEADFRKVVIKELHKEKQASRFNTTISFDSAQNCWRSESIRYGYTRKGPCKHTNGCTVIYKVEIVADAETGILSSVVRKKETLPNYE